MRTAGIGSMPGTEMPATLRQVLGSVSWPWLPELPGRGVGADMVGRTGAMLDGLSIDLQPQGWRLGAASGIDQGRALSWLRHDLDELEEAVQGYSGPLRITATGPWTMAACLERPRGDKVLADHGMRRELADSLASGLSSLLAEVARRMPMLELSVQLDEPMLPAVMAGRVPTSSGFSKHRSVDQPRSTDLLERVVTPLRGVVGQVGIHCCAPGLDAVVVERAGFDLQLRDLRTLAAADWDALGPWLEGGRGLVLGIAPTHQPDHLVGVDAMVGGVLRAARWLGIDPQLWLDHVDLSPACGLAGWTSIPAGRLLEQLGRAAELLPEQLVR